MIPWWAKALVATVAVGVTIWYVVDLWQDHVARPYIDEGARLGAEVEAERQKKELRDLFGVESVSDVHKMLLTLRGDLVAVNEANKRLAAESSRRKKAAAEEVANLAADLAELQKEIERESKAPMPVPNDPCASVCRLLSQPL
jgi:hypothetical protein